MGNEISIGDVVPERTGSVSAPERRRRASQITPGNFVCDQGADFSKKYKGLKVLGKGSYGEVVLCRDRVTSAEVAVKVIGKKHLKKPSEKEVLIKEVNLIKQLDHQNIMKVYEFYEDKSHFYLVGEHYSGGELFDELVKRKRFTEPDAAIATFQLLNGLNYMHKQDVVHRDLKPENILLAKPGKLHLKIIDFGLSTHFQRNTSKSMKEKIGTAYYVAPEVLRGNYNEKCDIWSVGVILYILLSGCPPFYGKNESEILARVELGKYTFNLPQWVKVSDAAKHLIRMMLFFVPNLRISAETALEHEWLTTHSGDSHKTILAYYKQVMKAANNAIIFCKTPQLGQAAMLYSASKLVNPDETMDLQKVFVALDRDNDGRITIDDIVEALSKAFKKTITKKQNTSVDSTRIKDIATYIFDQADADGSGHIEFSEFVALAMDKSKLLNDARRKRAFEIFDVNKEGKITEDSLCKMFDVNGKAAKLEVKSMIKQLDTNEDGKIDKKEFQGIMDEI